MSGTSYVQLSECRKLVCIRLSDRQLAFATVDKLISTKNLKTVFKGTPDSKNYLDEKNVHCSHQWLAYKPSGAVHSFFFSASEVDESKTEQSGPPKYEFEVVTAETAGSSTEKPPGPNASSTESAVIDFKVKFSKDEVSKGSNQSKVSKVKTPGQSNLDQVPFQTLFKHSTPMRNLCTLLLKFSQSEEIQESNTRLLIGVNSSLIEVNGSKYLCVDMFGGLTRSGLIGMVPHIDCRFYFPNFLEGYFLRKWSKIQTEAEQFKIRARLVGYRIPDTEKESKYHYFKLFLVLHTPVYRVRMQRFSFELRIKKDVMASLVSGKPADSVADSYRLHITDAQTVAHNDGRLAEPMSLTTDIITNPMNFKPCPKLPDQTNEWSYNLQVPVHMRTEILSRNF
jgi:hypothetical protein